MGRTPLSLLLIPAFLAACSALPEIEKPSLRLTLDGAAAKLGGEVRMDSPGTPPVRNPWVSVADGLGADDREFAFGGRIGWGDGFGGFELRYLRFTTSTATSSVPGWDFGLIRGGASVETESQLDEYRLDYVHPLLVDRSLIDRATIRLGAGLSWMHEDWRVIVREVAPTPSPLAEENIRARDDWGIPLLLGRAEIDFGQVGLRLDLGFMEGSFGDFNGTFIDGAATAWYEVQRGVRLMLGGWYHTLPAEGTEGGLPYEFDSYISGVTFGIRFDV